MLDEKFIKISDSSIYSISSNSEHLNSSIFFFLHKVKVKLFGTDTTVNEEKSSYNTEKEANINGFTANELLKLNLSTVSPKPKLFFQTARSNGIDLDSIATQPSVFDDPDKAKYFWPRSDYENIHRFDPSARWTWREEFNVVRKVDFRIMIFACVMFFALELDRANISQANTDNFLSDLNLTTNDFNNGNTIFKASFLFAELPSQLISKRVGPDRWVPAQMCLWSIVAFCQFWLSGRTSFYITRALLGMIQGGFIPDVILYLSYFYTGKELPIRLSFFWTTMYLADIASAFLGYGILHMRGVLSHSGWRWLFLIEGLLTMCIGGLAFLMMPAAPTKTASWFRGKNGWFTPREETIIVSRVVRDDPAKGSMHNRQRLTFSDIWKSVCDYDIWPIYLLGLVFSIPNSPVTTYLTLTLRSLGFGTFTSNLLSIPSIVLCFFQLLLITFLSERFKQRSWAALYSQIWMLPFIAALYSFSADTNRWIKYAITTLLIGYPYPHAIQVAWCSRNSNSVRTRTVSASLYNISAQISNIISSQIYRADDAPFYKRGNLILLIVNIVNILIYIGVRYYYIWRNKQKDAIWRSLSKHEQICYIKNTVDQGSKRLDFKFAY